VIFIDHIVMGVSCKISDTAQREKLAIDHHAESTSAIDSTDYEDAL